MLIIDILKKIFIKKNNMDNQEEKEVREAIAPKIENNTQPNKPYERRYEIAVYQADYETSDANGNPIAKWKKLNYEKPIIIKASCKKDLDELQRQYMACDQKFEIIRPLDPPEPPTKQTQQASTPTQTKIAEHAVHPINASSPNNNVQSTIQKPQTKPKIITIGDIQLKYDGDKIYQKQWVKVSSHEAANIRIVNDSNNKLVNLDGKHIEVKKWILVEQNENDNDDETFTSQD